MSITASFRTLRLLMIVLLGPIFGATASAATPPGPAVAPGRLAIAVYLPPKDLKSKTYLSNQPAWVEPGETWKAAITQTGNIYFSTPTLIPAEKAQHYSALLDLQPIWTPGPGKTTLSLSYNVYDASGRLLFSGNSTQTEKVGMGGIAQAVDKAITLSIKKIFSEAHTKLQNNATSLQTGSTTNIDYTALVDKKEPVRSGTAFFIDQNGHLLTSHSISADCTVIEAQQGSLTFPVTLKSTSSLLDISLLTSTHHSAIALVPEEASVALGTQITSIGYAVGAFPGDAPNFSRGNVSALQGLRGSLGNFQFSASVQPNNLGAPVISDSGTLLGMSVGMTNIDVLRKSGRVAPNVGFALDAQTITKFLRRENIFLAKPASQKTTSTLDDSIVSGIFQLNCYQ